MNQSHITASLIDRQDLTTQVQQLAARYPEQGINPDNVPLQLSTELAGTLAHLKHIHLEKGG